MATSNRYEFQPPMNMNAIRSNIMQRIKQRNEHNKQPLTPPLSSSSVAASKHDIQYIHLDNGLPSPPIESCTFDEDIDTIEMASNHNSTLPDSPPSPVMSLTKSCSSSTTETTAGETTLESSETIREKIRILKEEKHRLFQTMKDLLSQPAPPAAPETVVATASSVPIVEKPVAKQQQQQPLVSKPMVERSRSQSRDSSLKSRPISRSRSISHTEFSRPLSRYTGGNYYHDRRSPPRFYGNDNRSYPYNRSSYPHSSSQQSQSQNALLSSSSSSPSLNMSRRVLNSNNINNNNNNSSYVSSRSQLAGRPSSSAVAAVGGVGIASASAPTSTTFRPLNRSSSDRHSRY
ncbi:hypothetical protein MAM1_0010d01096 [Mucor ambiguus]|uniref:Uncharacterized protein n=1 Tax=Mucor ambiguus TaxID=91626 RepID=A0A0C9MF30_9FUNG|nr:hypothetical protein MAM1_0010d01096 [Mucor ambiguus]